MQILEPHIVRLVLEHLVERMEEGPHGLDELLREGIDPQLLELLRNGAARDFIQVAKHHQVSVGVTLDSAAVLRAFGRLDAIKADLKLREYFVINGASPDMLAELFKLTADEVRHLRALLMPGGTTPGRPRLPPVSERPSICDEWARIARQRPGAALRERIYALHQRFNTHSIVALWSAVNEFEDTSPRPVGR